MNAPAHIITLPGAQTALVERPVPGLPAHLLAALHTTLDAAELVALFVEELQGQLPHAEAAWRFEDEERWSRTPVGHYRYDYRLAVEDEPLGRLRIASPTPLGHLQLATVEQLAGALLYPLRNARNYRRALQAAQFDALTGLGNRYSFDQAVSTEIGLARRNRRPLSLIALDLDHFKRVNDTFGHATGDSVLRTAADIIKGGMRESDVAYRYGGEEFLILLRDTPRLGAHRLAERIRSALAARPLPVAGALIRITASLGVAQLAEGEEAAQLLDKADRAVYAAKRTGRDRVACWD